MNSDVFYHWGNGTSCIYSVINIIYIIYHTKCLISWPALGFNANCWCCYHVARSPRLLGEFVHQKCGGHTWSTRYFWFHVAKSGQGGPSPYQISGLTVLELWINLSDLNDGENLNEFWTNQSAKHLQWVGGKAEASIGCLPPSECQYVNTPSV